MVFLISKKYKLGYFVLYCTCTSPVLYSITDKLYISNNELHFFIKLTQLPSSIYDSIHY